MAAIGGLVEPALDERLEQALRLGLGRGFARIEQRQRVLAGSLRGAAARAARLVMYMVEDSCSDGTKKKPAGSGGPCGLQGRIRRSSPSMQASRVDRVVPATRARRVAAAAGGQWRWSRWLMALSIPIRGPRVNAKFERVPCRALRPA